MYVVTHKEFNPPFVHGYTPIAVGPLAEDASCPFIKDNAGESISEKNPTYCELTALYWIWKNDKDSDIVGLCHYRRYFTTHYSRFDQKGYLTEKEAETLLADHDLILPAPFWWSTRTVGENYYEGGMGYSGDLKTTRRVLESSFPAYLPAFDKVMNSHHASYCNMFVAPKCRLDEYCQWLFAILNEVEKRVDLTGYSPQEARIFGYLSELLLNVWAEHQKLSIVYLPLVNTDRGIIGNIKERFRIERAKHKVIRGDIS